MNGSPTIYTVDLAAGLIQVLADGTSSYLYGVGRIGEEQPAGWQYHLGDALGSVRQLADAGAAVSLARRYEPFGDTLMSAGAASTAFQFTGEARDGTGLTYLRARYYASDQGAFLQADPLLASSERPSTLSEWHYVENNPINLVDPARLRQYRIWAAAFIRLSFLPFLHMYDPHYEDPTYSEMIYGTIPRGALMPALHRGDGRPFYNGGGDRSARVWYNVTIETNPLLPPVVNSSSGTGWSQVSFVYNSPLSNYIGWGWARQKAPSPSHAQVTRLEYGCITRVDIDLISEPASGRNPLEPPAFTPSIEYRYYLNFDICRGKLSYGGQHGWFPWHELHVDGFVPLVRFSPPFPSPVALFFPPKSVREQELPLPIDELEFACPGNKFVQ